MNAHLLCLNALAWSVQIALLAIGGGAACVLFRVREARYRLLFLQIVLGMCLTVPLFSMRPPAERSAANAGVRIVQGPFAVRGIPATASWNAYDIVAAFLLAGIAVRLALLAVGLVRLRRLRKGALPIDAPPHVTALAVGLGVSARFMLSGDVLGPVAFGVRKPVVLLPPSFVDAAEETQQAIACHELIHLRRNDWLFTLAEESVRAVFWFHPAIWWLLARIQLAREEVVDQRAIACTRDRDSYVAALLATAAGMIEPDMAPAPLFLTRHNLPKRIASIQKGVRMSIRHTVSALLGGVPLLAVTALIGWNAFPLVGVGQVFASSPGVEVVNGFIMLRQTPVRYPAEALARGDAGYVVASVTLDASGAVADATIVSGPQALRKPVLSSVLQWRFDPDQTLPPDRTFEIGVRFTPPPAGTSDSEMPSLQVSRIDLGMVPVALRQQVADVLGPEGRLVTPVELAKFVGQLKNINPDLTLGVAVQPEDKVTLRPRILAEEARAVNAPGPNGEPPSRIRVGANVQAVNRISGPIPVYPPDAKQARIQGTVRFNAIIGTDGHVKSLELVSGHPLLVESAREAVSQWVYKPTLLNGNPVEVVTSIEVNYSLRE